MNRTAKALMSGCLIVIVVVAVLGALGWRYVATHKDEWLQRGQAAMGEGAAAGAKTDEPGCVDSALAKVKNDGSISSVIKVRLWLKGCLVTSQPTDDFCARVPQAIDLMKSIQWRSDTCTREGLGNNPNCPNMLDEVQKYCIGPDRAEKLRAR